MNFYTSILLIPILPFAGFLLNAVFGKKLGNAGAWLATLAVFIPFISVVYIFINLPSGSSQSLELSNWFYFKNIFIPFGFLVDSLTLVMLLVVTGIGSLIHLYSIGYMHGDEGFNRFFSYLNLFIFFMLILVMCNNYVMMFIGWEGVGLCSYLLIGFWFKNQAYNDAAKKAFIMNRIGDLGFLIGIFMMLFYFNSVEYGKVMTKAASYESGNGILFAITLFLFIGAIGKSAQIPLYTWLPDAMAGPTPVSALIHAATMVTAGIYMVVRSNVMFALSPLTSQIVLGIGVATALFSSLIGLKQTDIKKVLAYSTVSQLGYMFAALGVGAYKAAIFHVVTHAFFKALLFLGSGSVIHAMGGEQDIRRMGGLRKALPLTHFTFLIGTLAIAGCPPLAGFFSKDEILASVFSHAQLYFAVLALTSVVTAIYMFRLYFLTFSGEFRGTEEQKDHLHESPVTITLPLMVLAILSAFGGFLGMPEVMHQPHLIGNFLSSSISSEGSHHVSHVFEYSLMGVSILAVALIIFLCYRFFVAQQHVPENDSEVKGIQKWLANKFYIDEFYDKLIVRPLMICSDLFLVLIDKLIVDLAVNIIAWIAGLSGRLLRLIQSGHTGFYMFAMVAGMIILLLVQLFLTR